MNITTTILTVGTALRHAHSHETPVHVLCGTSWLTGRVIGLDGEGVALYTPDEETLVIRIAGISAVRMKTSATQMDEHSPRPTYDGLTFPTTLPNDLTTLGVTTAAPPRRVPEHEPEREPEPEHEPVLSPYPVGHPARSGR